MKNLQEKVRKLADLEQGILPNGQMADAMGAPDFLLSAAWDEVVDVAKGNPDGAWEVFRYGTDDEFAALINWVGYIGKDFESDKALREVMRLARKRSSTPEVLQATRAGFGVLFDRFWNETEPKPAPTRKARTFSQARQSAAQGHIGA